ncbi:hypothetical protein GCM10027456_30600 [Kineosporia babensis]
MNDLDRAAAGRLEDYRTASDRSDRALALAQVGRYDEADRKMAEALAVTPDSAWAHLRKARLELLRGDIAGMALALRRAMETSEPPLTERQRALAEALLRLG